MGQVAYDYNTARRRKAPQTQRKTALRLEKGGKRRLSPLQAALRNAMHLVAAALLTGFAISLLMSEAQLVELNDQIQDAKAQLAKAAAKAEKAAAAKPEDEKLAEAAARAKKAADDAAAGVAVPETFKDYLDKWVYSVKDNDELLDKIGGARLMRLKNEPHLGYSTRH